MLRAAVRHSKAWLWEMKRQDGIKVQEKGAWTGSNWQGLCPSFSRIDPTTQLYKASDIRAAGRGEAQVFSESRTSGGANSWDSVCPFDISLVETPKHVAQRKPQSYWRCLAVSSQTKRPLTACLPCISSSD
jgi:hypothetical protein